GAGYRRATASTKAGRAAAPGRTGPAGPSFPPSQPGTPEVPQQDAAGNAGVEAFHAIGHGDADGPVAGVDGLLGEALPLAADDDAHPALPCPGGAQRLGAVEGGGQALDAPAAQRGDRKSTRLNSSHVSI